MFADVGVTMNLNPTERGALVEQIFSRSRDDLPGRPGRRLERHRRRRPRARGLLRPRLVAARLEQLELLRERPRRGAARGRRRDRRPRRAPGIYAEAQQIIHEDAPWVFLYSPDNLTGQRMGVTGIAYYPNKQIDPRRIALP
jgi:hypothetical protein